MKPIRASAACRVASDRSLENRICSHPAPEMSRHPQAIEDRSIQPAGVSVPAVRTNKCPQRTWNGRFTTGFSSILKGTTSALDMNPSYALYQAVRDKKVYPNRYIGEQSLTHPRCAYLCNTFRELYRKHVTKTEIALNGLHLPQSPALIIDFPVQVSHVPIDSRSLGYDGIPQRIKHRAKRKNVLVGYQDAIWPIIAGILPARGRVSRRRIACLIRRCPSCTLARRHGLEITSVRGCGRLHLRGSLPSGNELEFRRRRGKWRRHVVQ